MRESHQRTIAVWEVVREIALTDPVVNRVIAPMQVGHVFQQIIDKEKDVHVIDVLSRFGQVVSFVGLSFERSIVRAEVPGSLGRLRERLLNREHVLNQRVWSSHRSQHARRIRAFVVISQTNAQQALGLAVTVELQLARIGIRHHRMIRIDVRRVRKCWRLRVHLVLAEQNLAAVRINLGDVKAERIARERNHVPGQLVTICSRKDVESRRAQNRRDFRLQRIQRGREILIRA